MDQITEIRANLNQIYNNLTGKDLSTEKIPEYEVPQGKDLEVLLKEEIQKIRQLTVPASMIPQPAWTPPMEVLESEGKVVFILELPGVGKEDVKAEVVSGMLNVCGESKMAENESVKVVHCERAYGRFQRMIALPRSAKPGTLQAECKDGLLKVVVELTPEETPKPIKINVQ